MKKKLLIIVGMVFAFALVVIFAASKDYYVVRKNSYHPYAGAKDIYNASREELIEMDLCNYTKAFGEVQNEQEAFRIASNVIEEIYQKNEAPYRIKFNENANAWIVVGAPRFFRLGGSASIAIDKETGEILMLIHTK